MSSYDPELLIVLEKHIRKYNAMSSLVKTRGLTTSSIFTPTMIRTLDQEFNANPLLLSESLSFIEQLLFLSSFFNNKETNIVSQVMTNIALTRLNLNESMFLSDILKNDYAIRQDDKDFMEFLGANFHLVGLYTYTLLHSLYYEE